MEYGVAMKPKNWQYYIMLPKSMEQKLFLEKM